MSAIQLSFDGFEAEGLDPYELARLSILDRAALYGELRLDGFQRQAAEEAVRLVLARRYGRAVR